MEPYDYDDGFSNNNSLRDKRDIVEWFYTSEILNNLITEFHIVTPSDEGSDKKTYTYLSKLLGGLVRVEYNTPQNYKCSGCAYEQVCHKYTELVTDEIGGVCTPNQSYLVESKLYSVEELYQQLDEINNAPISEEEKHNNMKLLIMIEYEKYKREN